MNTRKFVFASFAVLALSLTACGSNSAANDDEPAADEGALTNRARSGGRFETFKGVDDGNYFRLVASNGLKLLRSEAYSSSPDATIRSLVKAAVDGEDDRFQVLPAADGGHYVNVIGAGNSREIIATSEVYSSASKARNAVKVIQGYLKGIGDAAYVPAERGKRFQLFKVEGMPEPFKFTLHADNGETVLASEWYSSKQAAQKGIDAVKNYGRLHENYAASEIERGRGVFSLKAKVNADEERSASNHETVAFSEVYSSKSNAERGLEAAWKTLRADVDIVDTTR